MNISNTLEQIMSQNSPKKDYKFMCTFCNFNTSNKKDWNKHIVTIKHSTLSNGAFLNTLNNNLPQKNPKPVKLLVCDNCNKNYLARSGLWYHKKNCTKIIKEDSDKEKFRYAIKHIAHKNIQMIPEWKKENPEYKLNDGYSNDQFMQLVMESMGGSDKIQELGYQDKIISKVAKHVVIDK